MFYCIQSIRNQTLQEGTFGYKDDCLYCVPAQESLAVVYAPSSPRVYTIYEPVIRLKGQAKTVVTQRPFSSKEAQSVSLEFGALRALLPTETQGLQSVLHKIGGTGNFVFLFAQVG